MLTVCCSHSHRLRFKWPFPLSLSLVSTCLKTIVEQDYDLACQVKSWYDTESYGAYNHIDPRSAAEARAQEVHETSTFHNGQRYDVGMLCADDNIQLLNNYFSSLVQLKSLKTRLSRDTTFNENHAKTISEDL